MSYGFPTKDVPRYVQVLVELAHPEMQMNNGNIMKPGTCLLLQQLITWTSDKKLFGIGILVRFLQCSICFQDSWKSPTKQSLSSLSNHCRKDSGLEWCLDIKYQVVTMYQDLSDEATVASAMVFYKAKTSQFQNVSKYIHTYLGVTEYYPCDATNIY